MSEEEILPETMKVTDGDGTECPNTPFPVPPPSSTRRTMRTSHRFIGRLYKIILFLVFLPLLPPFIPPFYYFLFFSNKRI